MRRLLAALVAALLVQGCITVGVWSPKRNKGIAEWRTHVESTGEPIEAGGVKVGGRW